MWWEPCHCVVRHEGHAARESARRLFAHHGLFWCTERGSMIYGTALGREACVWRSCFALVSVWCSFKWCTVPVACMVILMYKVCAAKCEVPHGV